jgi:hypothetical protein
MGYGSMAINWRISKDGSAELHRHVLVEAYSRLQSLDTFLVVPEATSDHLTTVIPVKVSEDMAEALSERKVRLGPIAKDAGRLTAIIDISPALETGDAVPYIMEEKLPAGLYKIHEEDLARRTTPYEYVGWTISRPTRRISVTVCFPPNLQPEEPDLEVRIQGAAPGTVTQRHHEEEENGLRQSYPKAGWTTDGRYELMLEVSYPVLGLIYFLRWKKLKEVGKTVTID